MLYINVFIFGMYFKKYTFVCTEESDPPPLTFKFVDVPKITKKNRLTPFLLFNGCKNYIQPL